MSRHYPELRDIEYFTDWAADKVLQMTQKGHYINFQDIADFSRSVAVYLNVLEGAFDHSQQWLRRRISDTYYILSSMRHYEAKPEEFNRLENDLIDILQYLVEYLEENGISGQNVVSKFDESKV